MRAVTASVLAAALALGACGDDSDPSATDADATTTTGMAGTTETTAAGGGAAAGTTITIKDFKFNPEKLSAKVGDEITVTNNDSAPHTLTAKDKSVDTGTLQEKASGTITLARAGTLEYVCNIHDYMTGSIEVE